MTRVGGPLTARGRTLAETPPVAPGGWRLLWSRDSIRVQSVAANSERTIDQICSALELQAAKASAGAFFAHVEADFPVRPFRGRLHEFADGFEDGVELRVLLADAGLQFGELAAPIAVGVEQPAP